MDRLSERLALATAAADRLGEALAIEQPSDLERDGALQRFEFSFEATWKATRLWLTQAHGLDVGSPKAVIRAMAQAGAFDDATTTAALALADDRNRTVHVYDEATAEAIFARLGAHYELLRKWLAYMEPVTAK